MAGKIIFTSPKRPKVKKRKKETNQRKEGENFYTAFHADVLISTVCVRFHVGEGKKEKKIFRNKRKQKHEVLARPFLVPPSSCNAIRNSFSCMRTPRQKTPIFSQYAETRLRFEKKRMVMVVLSAFFFSFLFLIADLPSF